MKYKLFPLLIAIIFMTAISFIDKDVANFEKPSELVHWYTWEEAMKLNRTNPKNIFVDIYTSWCGYCKKMDKKTFNDKDVAKYLNENFYPIKLDAEQKDDIVYNGQTYSYVKTDGRRDGIHILAYSLLEGKLSYPTTVFLDSNIDRIMTSPGYKTADQFMTELKFSYEKHYLTKTFNQYLAE